MKIRKICFSVIFALVCLFSAAVGAEDIPFEDFTNRGFETAVDEDITNAYQSVISWDASGAFGSSGAMRIDSKSHALGGCNIPAVMKKGISYKVSFDMKWIDDSFNVPANKPAVIFIYAREGQSDNWAPYYGNMDIKDNGNGWYNVSFNKNLNDDTFVDTTPVKVQIRLGQPNTSALIDNFSLERIVSGSNELSEMNVSGEYKSGNTITADFVDSTDENTSFQYKILISDNGANWSLRECGTAAEKGFSYNIRETDQGKYIKLSVIGFDGSGYTNVLESESRRVYIPFEYSGGIKGEIAANSELTCDYSIINNTDEDISVAGFLVLYDETGRVYDMDYTKALIGANGGNFTFSDLSVKSGENYEGYYAKLLMWETAEKGVTNMTTAFTSLLHNAD